MSGVASVVHGAGQSCGPPIRVMLVDDHEVTLWGLRQLLESGAPHVTIAGVARTRAELLSHPALAMTDVVLLDLGLGEANAIDCVGTLVAEHGVKVVLLTGDLDPTHHRDAVLRGARGVVLKSQPTESIFDAITRVHRGEVWIDGALMSMLLSSVPGAPERRSPPPRNSDEARIDTLTPKERDVIRAVVRHRGAKSLVVAETLRISEHTLRNHLTVIYGKLAVQGRLSLYAYALEHGLAPAGVVLRKFAPPGVGATVHA